MDLGALLTSVEVVVEAVVVVDNVDVVDDVGVVEDVDVVDVLAVVAFVVVVDVEVGVEFVTAFEKLVKLNFLRPFVKIEAVEVTISSFFSNTTSFEATKGFSNSEDSFTASFSPADDEYLTDTTENE